MDEYSAKRLTRIEQKVDLILGIVTFLIAFIWSDHFSGHWAKDYGLNPTLVWWGMFIFVLVLLTASARRINRI